jgi:hypothetical protein
MTTTTNSALAVTRLPTDLVGSPTVEPDAVVKVVAAFLSKLAVELTAEDTALVKAFMLLVTLVDR